VQTVCSSGGGLTIAQSCPWVGSTHGLGWVRLVWAGLGWVFLAFWWVELGCESETFPKILKLGRPLVTGEVIPDNLIMINANK